MFHYRFLRGAWDKDSKGSFSKLGGDYIMLVENDPEGVSRTDGTMVYNQSIYSGINEGEATGPANAHDEGTNFLRSDGSVSFAEDEKTLKEEASHPAQDW